METITFTCKVITPMFLAGADGRTPELRAPSIKGAMRFWWRAMHGEEDLGKLKKREEKIFGGGGESARRSSFSLHISYEQKDLKIKNKRDNTDYINSINTQYKGIAYLLYSTFMDYENLKTPILDGTFKIKFMFKDSEDQNILNDIIDAFKSLIYLGGVGSRSRRGAGSVSVEDIQVSNGLKSKENNLREIFLLDIPNKSDLEKFINNNFYNEKEIKSFSNLHGAKIYLFDAKDNWKDALESIAILYKNFRHINKSLISVTPNFGFPITHRSNQANKTTMVAGPTAIKKKEDLLNRRASPIIFKVFNSGNRYFPLIIWLSGDLLPPKYEIMDKLFNNTSKPNNTIINDFFDQIKEPKYIIEL